jgi:hypothetical protein
LTTLAEAIAECLATGRIIHAPLSDGDRALLERWQVALDTDRYKWQHISKLFKNPSGVVVLVLSALHSAQEDDKSGYNNWAHKRHEECERLLELASMASALADYYKEQQQCIVVNDDEDADQEFEREYNRLEDLADSQAHQAAAFRKAAEARKPISYVSVSQKIKGRKEKRNREQDLFMRHLSRQMAMLYGTPHDLAVAEITTLIYKVQISKKTVEKQRGRTPKVTPLFSANKS